MSDNLRFKALGDAKFLLILGVILIHSNPTEGIPDGFPEPAYNIINFISGNLCAACVPAFFIISGFLFFLNVPPSGKDFFCIYSDKLKRRIRSLLVPYVLWNLFGGAIFLLKAGILGFPGYDVLSKDGFNLQAFIYGFWDVANGYPYDYVLWFIRNLMIFCLLAPLFYIIGRSGPLFIVFLTLCLAFGQDLWGGIYFLTGAWLAFHKDCMLYILHKSSFMLAAGFVSWLCFGVLISFGHDSDRIYTLFSVLRNLGGTIAFLSLGNLLVKSIQCQRIMGYLIPGTFFIYAFHGLFSRMTRKFWMMIVGFSDNWQLLTVYILSFITLTTVSWVIWRCARHVFPRFTATLTGNR